ncbi:MAG: hypothetical protein ACREV5_00890 [Steroidobacter sp.]
MARITRKDARNYLRRWDAASAAEQREVRETSIEIKLQQTAALMASAALFTDSADQARLEEEVRARWVRIRRAHGV